MTLDQIAIKHGTDKSSKHHNYTPYYERYLEHLRKEPITLIEVGYGGYDYKDRGGQSARMWLEYFPQAEIIVVDLFDKANLPQDKRFSFFQLSQTDERIGILTSDYNPDVFIDDGSHHNEHVSKTFGIVFPRLKPGSLYIVEDVHTSYWKENYGGSLSETEPTTMNYFKRLTDHLNHQTNGLEDLGIEWIHFYKEIIFIKKK